jgi:hypothetical protein
LCLLAAFVVASLTAEPGSWHDTVMWAREFRHARPARAASCPVLVGDGLPGDSRQAYERAGQLCIGITPEAVLSPAERQRLRDIASQPSRATACDQALLAKVPAAAIEELRRSVRSNGGMHDSERLGRRPPGSVFGDQEVLIDALLIQAVRAPSESAKLEAWLDVFACGWDLAGSALPIESMWGLVIVVRALDLAGEAWLQALSPLAQRQLGEALAKVDAATPVCIDLQGVVADMVLWVDEAPDLRAADIGMRSPLPLWRHGFSVERAAIDKVTRVHEQVSRFLRDTDAQAAWPVRRLALQQLVDEDRSHSDYMMSGYLSFALEGEQQRRECVARMRLLRVAIAVHLGESLQLPDPLGEGALSQSRDGDRVRLASAEPGIHRFVRLP